MEISFCVLCIVCVYKALKENKDEHQNDNVDDNNDIEICKANDKDDDQFHSCTARVAAAAYIPKVLVCLRVMYLCFTISTYCSLYTKGLLIISLY